MIPAKKIILLCVALLGLFCSAAIIKDDPIADLLVKLEAYAKKNPQEKVYLQLDKPYYAIGDNIWFKAYVTDSRTAQPSGTSNILYAELINDRGEVKTQLKLALLNGISWGDFKLSDTLSEGNYRIRAYTQWMRNAGPAFFFDKTIKIGNAWANQVFTSTTYRFTKENSRQKVSSTISFKDKDGKPFAKSAVTYQVMLDSAQPKQKAVTDNNGTVNISFIAPDNYNQGQVVAVITMPDKKMVTKTIPIKATSSAVDVQFLPEGGQLVTGLPCKIGIKAVNASGLGENISGAVTDDDGNEVVDFKTTYLGMGTLFLNPVAGKSYSAVIRFADGSERKTALPKAAASGYAMAVSETDSTRINVKVMLSEDLMNKGGLTLVGQRSGTVYFVTKIPANKQVATTVVPTGDLPSGILQLTLFSPANLPVCERIAFVNNTGDKIDLSISPLKTSYHAKEKVVLNFTASLNQKPVQGSFSVSVTNANAVSPDLENESNILTSLLLTADLKGYVENPNHYFLSRDTKTKAELDNLLLTQGWRKIAWETVAAEPPPPVFEAEKYMQIKGTITAASGKPIPNAKISLFSSVAGLALDTLSDEHGKFNFDRLQFKDSTRFVIQGRYGKDKSNLKIVLDTVPGQSVTENPNAADVEVNVNAVMMTYLDQSNQYFEEQVKEGFLKKEGIAIKEIEISAKKQNKAPNSLNLNGPGRADFIVTGKELEHTPSLGFYIKQGRVPGVFFTSGAAFSTRITSLSELDTVTGPDGEIRPDKPPMQVIIDGVAVNSEGILDNMDLEGIESIEFIKSISLMTIYGVSDGVIIITTRKGTGRDINSVNTPGLITYQPKGYSPSKAFYSPKYETPNNAPDLRSTIFWEPNVLSDAGGKASTSFYNAGAPGNYRVVIEGIDADGNLARKVFSYIVGQQL